MVIEREVIGSLLLSLMTCSLNQGLDDVIAGVTVTPPVPVPPPAITVRIKVVLRVSPPPVPLTVKFTVPGAATLEAVRVRILLALVVEAGLNAAVTPLDNPVALNATELVNPPVRIIETVLVPLAP